MKFEKTIPLTPYEVEYIDQRQEKPRAVQREIVVLDGSKLSALERLGMRPAGYISLQFEREGYAVTNIHRGESINAHVDLSELLNKTRKEIELQQVIAKSRHGGSSDADK